MLVTVPLSPGEVLDKISILEVKITCLKDDVKRAMAQKELVLLLAHKERLLANTDTMDSYINLRLRNRWLFDAEDAIRESLRKIDSLSEKCAAQGIEDYLPLEAEQAQALQWIKVIHKYNRERAEIKAEINLNLNSSIFEAKLYAGTT